MTSTVETIMSSPLAVIHDLLRTTYANPDRYSLDLLRESRASFVGAFFFSTYSNVLEARRNATSTIKASGLGTYRLETTVCFKYLTRLWQASTRQLSAGLGDQTHARFLERAVE